MNQLRGGTNEIPNKNNSTAEKINQTLKESEKFTKLEKNLISKSINDSKSFTNNSFNKILIRIIDKIESIRLSHLWIDSKN